MLVGLEALRRTAPPDGIETLEAVRDAVVGWGRVAADPEPLLATGLCSPGWLERALPARAVRELGLEPPR